MSDTVMPSNINRRRLSAALCVCGVLAMLGAAYGAVPLYKLFCQLTGFAGTTQRAAAAPGTILDRTITVRFDAMVAPDLAWHVAPLRKKVQVRLGETKTVFYRATNLSNRPVSGTSLYSVASDEMGAYFNKIDCFCFTEQTLAPGESRDMGVTFFVSPDLQRDKDFHGNDTVMLTYTFYTGSGAPV